MEISSFSLIFPISVTIYLTLLFGNGIDVANARAYFVFGDSLVDNGNNNFLATTARADAPPYGIDSVSHQPSGRFSNGLNIVDLIGEYFDFQPNRPYLDPNLKGEQLLAGANFASAGVGILNDTGFQFLNIIRINQQFEYFKEYQGKLLNLTGPANTTKLLNDSLALISLGGNDFVNNYYLFPITLRSFQYSLSEYCPYLISEYQKVLEELYFLGLGKIIVTGTGPLGCAPAQKAQRSQNGECATELQNAANIFNPLLAKMVLGLNKKIGRDIFIVADISAFSLQIITNPQAYGFENSDDACCGQGPHNGIGLCTVISNLCENRDKYVYWDAYHPTERGNRLIVQQMINGTTKYMNPMNLSTIKSMFSNS